MYVTICIHNLVMYYLVLYTCICNLVARYCINLEVLLCVMCITRLSRSNLVDVYMFICINLVVICVLLVAISRLVG